ncbi:MAG: DUF928 domain-containing protein [Cyanobacteriota bacterium]|nr:DUF928 domain-containing protein [Cyanobacteriota bacterium]
MAWFTRLSRFTTLAIILAATLALALFINISKQVQAQSHSPSLSSVLENAFRPSTPPLGAENRVPGYCRSNRCFSEEYPLTAIVPVSGVGETIAAEPTVFWYMPEIDFDRDALSPAMEFLLIDASKQTVLSVKYPLAKPANGSVGSPGIMSFSVAHSQPVKFGEEYHWEVSLTCDSTSTDRSCDLFVEGGFKRVKYDPTLAQHLLQATPYERVAIYAKAGLWYETVDSLLELRRKYPNDKNLAEAWKTLLKTVMLDEISSAPINKVALTN